MSGAADIVQETKTNEQKPDEQKPDDAKEVTDDLKKMKIDNPSDVPIVLRGVIGEVKWFSLYTGYGFIKREDNEKDIFVHSSAIVRYGRLQYGLVEGSKVEFDVIQGMKGPEAWAVTAPGGKIVQGIRFVRMSYNRRPMQPRKTIKEIVTKTKFEENNNRKINEKERVMNKADGGDAPMAKSDYSKGEGQRRFSYKGNRKNPRKPKRKDSSETMTTEKEIHSVTESVTA